MTPPRRHVHPRLGPVAVAFEAPGDWSWTEDDTALVTTEAARASIDRHRRQMEAEGRLGELIGGEPAGRKAAPKRRKKDPAPNQSAMFASTPEGDSDGRYD